MKRAFDIISATVLLVVLLPLLLLLGILIRVIDGSPILFRQRRVGRGGRDFDIFKFRTMSHPPRITTCELPATSESLGPGRKVKSGSFEPGDRSRVTRLGRLLRKSKMDEMPQLWNVLRGDMSLVGPRPEVRRWVEAYPERWKVVHTVAPGVTDPASIEFRDEEEWLAGVDDPESVYRESVLPRKLTIYEEYVARHGFVGDLRILFRTVFAVLRA